MLNNKILILGANSFIGLHMARFYLGHGYDVLATYRNNSIALEQLKLEYDKSLKIIQLNISKYDDFEVIKEYVDYIIFIAGVTTVKNSIFEPILETNVLGALNAHRFSTINGVKKIINLSSISIYGDIFSGKLTSNTEINKPEIYGISKLMCEKLLEMTSKKIPVISIRLPGVLGYGAHTAWIPSLAKQLLNKLPVEIYGPDNDFNNAIHVDDLCKFSLNLLKNKNHFENKQVVVGAKDSIKIRKLVDILKVGLKSESQIIYSSKSKNSFIISSEDAILLGYDPSSIENILERYLTDLRKQIIS